MKSSTSSSYHRPVCIASQSVLIALLGLSAPATAAQLIGVAADDTHNEVIVFDAETSSILAAIRLSGNGLGDCVISVSRQLAFVTDFSGRVSVIDLAQSPPRLAAGVSRIPISNAGQDLALTADERFLVVTGGGNVAPLCVIDVETRQQISTFSTGSDCTSVDIAADGSVFVTSRTANRIRRLSLDAAGVLSNTGQWVGFNQPNNVYAAPDGAWGVAMGRAGGQFGSFQVDGMNSLDRWPQADMGLCGVFDPDGSRFYARTTGPGMVTVFDFDQATGRLGPAPLFAFSVADAPTSFGVDQLAIHPSGMLLYVSAPGGVQIHDTATGMLVGAISDASIGTMTGVTIADLSPEPQNQPPTIAALEWVLLRSRDHRLHDLGPRVMAEDPDGDAVSVSCVMYSNEAEAANGDGSGRHAPDFKNELFEGGRGFLVRGERIGGGHGRTGRHYLLVITADDGRGGVTTDACIAAIVPHDNSRPSLNRAILAAELALADLRAALQADGPMPEGLTEIGLANAKGPHQ